MSEGTVATVGQTLIKFDAPGYENLKFKGDHGDEPKVEEKKEEVKQEQAAPAQPKNASSPCHLCANMRVKRCRHSPRSRNRKNGRVLKQDIDAYLAGGTAPQTEAKAQAVEEKLSQHNNNKKQHQQLNQLY